MDPKKTSKHDWEKPAVLLPNFRTFGSPSMKKKLRRYNSTVCNVKSILLYVALRWTSHGRRKPGQPKTTWRKAVIAELQDMGLSWGEAQAAAKDRTQWRNMVVALCPTGDE